jgi:ribulose 1,5-bisphosphate synthetase/thiazole synthase
MRRTHPIRVGDLLAGFVRDNPRLTGLMLESRAIEAWKACVDPAVADATLRVTVSNRKMTVWLGSSVLRHEVFMRRTALIARINDSLGEPVITALYVK